MNNNNGERIFDIIVFAIVTLWGIIVAYPFYNTILISFVTSDEYSATPLMLYPKNPTLDAYRFIFSNDAFINGFKVTFFVLIVGVLYNMFLTVTTAYALSRPKFPGKTIFVNIIIFTMFFSGGLIPFYLLVNSLGLKNSLLSMILPMGLATWYMLIVRNYFQSIPAEIEESAKIDGANDIIILVRIILPLSLPVLATFVLFYAVDRWNEWYNGMLFIRSSAKFPLQLVLRRIIQQFNSTDSGSSELLAQTVYQNGVRMAAVVVVMTPIMTVYPFLQKYFLKGLLVGAVKS